MGNINLLSMNTLLAVVVVKLGYIHSPHPRGHGPIPWYSITYMIYRCSLHENNRNTAKLTLKTNKPIAFSLRKDIYQPTPP